jgi:DNA adenine methylase
VLFNKPPSNIETVNDLDNRVYNLFKFIREEPERLAKALSTIPFSRHVYNETFEPVENESDFDSVIRFLTQCWQGHGFRINGHKVGWKHDVQGREKMYALNNWYNLPNAVIETAERLRQVQIENQDAAELIKRFNYKNVLIYCDPPYVLGTRTGKQYKHEMTDKDHHVLLETLLNHKGPVILSGYDNDLYNEALKGWSKDCINSNTEYYNGAGRTEVLWMNFKSDYEQLSMTI